MPDDTINDTTTPKPGTTVNDTTTPKSPGEDSSREKLEEIWRNAPRSVRKAGTAKTQKRRKRRGKVRKFFLGESVDPPKEVEARGEDGTAARQEQRDKSAEADHKREVARTDFGYGRQVAGEQSQAAEADIDRSTNLLQQQRMLSGALGQAVEGTGNLAQAQQEQAQQQAASQQAAMLAGGGNLGAMLAGGVQQGVGMAGQAGTAVGQEAIQRQEQQGGIRMQQGGADLGQQGLGQALQMGGSQQALENQAALMQSAQTTGQMGDASLLERQRMKLMSDLRIRQATENQPQRGGILSGALGGIGAIVGGIYGGGAAGAAAGGAAGEGIGTGISEGVNQ